MLKEHKIMPFLGIIIFLFFLNLSSPVLAAVKIKIVSPPNKVWVEEKNIFLAGRIEGNLVNKYHKVSIKGVRIVSPKDRKVLVKYGAFGAIIQLRDGLNKIKLNIDGTQAQIEVFYLSSKAQQRGKTPPKGFRHYYVHPSPQLLSCRQCHFFSQDTFVFERRLPTPANCTTGNCHSNMGKAPYVHGPVGAKVCIACHNPHGSFEELELQKTGPLLCFSCHQEKKSEFSKEVVHAPVEESCIDCHDPHQSSMRFQLKAEGNNVSNLCFNCHDKEMFTKKYAHGPVALGDCIACHYPHASDYNALLVAPEEKGKLCFQCHQDKQEEFQMKYKHEPAIEDCNLCHNPHSSNTRYQLVKPQGKLCKSCHGELNPEVYQAIQDKYPHKPVKDNHCTACHRPHASNYELLLKNDTKDLCFSCHQELGSYIRAAKYKHGPVQTGDCVACHNVHGSKYVSLLIKYFPPQFYTDYKPENYDLCFSCHNKDIARTQFTDILTNFRDGQLNLHYKHVHRKKGRSCIACHDPHASNQPKHIRYEVPFGMWAYPIRFTKTPTGGLCVVGCHAPKKYDRVHPVFWRSGARPTK